MSAIADVALHMSFGRPSGVDSLGFEGVRTDDPRLESFDGVLGGVDRVRRDQGVLSGERRRLRATPVALANSHGHPDRIDELARDMAYRNVQNLDRYAAEAAVVPLSQVAAEGLRWLDDYLDRSDELHPASHLLLARATTGAAERMPLPGENIDLAEPPPVGSPRLQAARARLTEAARYAGSRQLEFHAQRTAIAQRMSLGLGWEARRGLTLDQQV